MRGLSPLARGTRHPQLVRHGSIRFIPAGAGNTTRDNAGYSRKTVYPRWRGEHKRFKSTGQPGYGLSPLARGTQFPVGTQCGHQRFIPAGAGNTRYQPSSAPVQTVYPRWRGEHRFKNNARVSRAGLSPLARGTPLHTPPGGFKRRFIPAGAGNTSDGNLKTPHGAVYPRWRGEHREKRSLSQNSLGLSPLARGTRPRINNDEQGVRFIPAGAGNTAEYDADAAGLTVYPRWRGEHVMSPSIFCAFTGLSPLARGTQKFGSPRVRLCRFIPAGAGNTKIRIPTRPFMSVYPRWRGEHVRDTAW